VNTETDPEISEYFEVKQIPGLLVIRERAGIHAQVGEMGAPALDEIIKGALEFDNVLDWIEQMTRRNWHRILQRPEVFVRQRPGLDWR